MTMNPTTIPARRHIATLMAALLPLIALGCSDEAAAPGDAPDNNAPGNNDPGNNAPNNDPGNNTPNNAPAACTADADCGQGEVCDTDAGLCRQACGSDDDCALTTRCGQGGFCVSRARCDDQSACAQGELCDTCLGRCERAPTGARACTTDTNCFVEEFCDPCRKTCRTLGDPCDPCNEDIECGAADDLCLDFTQGGRFCGRACTSLTDCPRGFVCDPIEGLGSQCVPASGDCASPEGCLDNDDCPSGQQCSAQLTCVPGCSPGSCPNGEVCDAGACVAPCASSAECPPGAECLPDGLCRIPGGCITSRDCPDAGTFCDVEQQRCLEGCEADSDCPSLQICRSNQCQVRPCDGNHLCGFGQVCNFDTGRCGEPDGPFCDPCDAEAEGQCGGEPNQCLRISDDEGNALGDFCGVACDPDNLDACPVGYSCTELQDQNMQVIGNVCFRNCTRNPI